MWTETNCECESCIASRKVVELSNKIKLTAGDEKERLMEEYLKLLELNFNYQIGGNYGLHYGWETGEHKN